MANVNAQAVEEFQDRVVYRYPGGRFEQALTNFAGALGVGLKTLVNTDTSRTYVVPNSGISARFYKVNIDIYVCIEGTETTFGLTLIKTSFFRVSMPTLNFDGKPLLTDFYKENNELFVTSSQLRAINIGNMLVEPANEFSNIQGTALSTVSLGGGAGTTGIFAYMQPTVTFYKK